jgi:hypothetical protein
VKRAAVLLDACCVLAFVLIGRASHGEAASITGLARTAWPFLAGLAVGLAGTRAWRRPAAIVPTGIGAWLATVGVGMVLRVVSGQGTAAAFVLVALAFLGLFMLGWRVLARAAAWVRAPSS